MAPRCSIWLVPGTRHRRHLQALIDGLAREHGTTSFQPHVTLLSVDADPATVDAAVAEVARRTAPIVAIAGQTTHSAEWRRTLVIELDDPAIIELGRDLAQSLRVQFDVDDLAPHLSLTYHDDLGGRSRDQIAAEIDLRGQPLTFDALAVMQSGSDVRRVDQWRVAPPVPLDG